MANKGRWAFMIGFLNPHLSLITRMLSVTSFAARESCEPQPHACASVQRCTSPEQAAPPAPGLTMRFPNSYPTLLESQLRGRGT